MSKIIRFFRTTSTFANIIVIVTLIIWLVKLAIFNKYSELFPFASESGLVFESILAQVVASYVFYLFFVHPKDLRDRELVWPHIIRNSYLIHNDAKSHLKAIADASGTKINFDTATRSEVMEVFSAIPVSSSPNMMVGLTNKATWAQFASSNALRCKEFSDNILQLGQLVDTRIVSIITALLDAGYLKSMISLSQISGINPSINNLGSSAFDYFDLARELERQISRAGKSLEGGGKSVAEMRSLIQTPRSPDRPLGSRPPPPVSP